jgi:hypothetical protein
MSEKMDQLREKLLSLQTAILEANPRMPLLLRDIHHMMAQDPHCVTVLTPEEISIVTSGLAKQTNTVITAKAIKSAGTKKAASKIGLMDL